MRAPALSPAIFLDRDGTLMTDVEYCGDPGRVSVFPDASEALARLRGASFRLVVVTNQSGIGRGYFNEADFQRVQSEMLRQLGGAETFDGVYHCPDHPDHATGRRKPGTGMLLEAASDLGLDLGRSYLVGDSRTDVECARAAGLAGSIFVLTGKAPGELATCQPSIAVSDLRAAADWILQQPR